jgi:hypothetical protein
MRQRRQGIFLTSLVRELVWTERFLPISAEMAGQNDRSLESLAGQMPLFGRTYKQSHNCFNIFRGIYYILGNLQPMYHSTIHNIHLMCIAKTDDIKAYGIDALFHPIVEEINSLATVKCL